MSRGVRSPEESGLRLGDDATHLIYRKARTYNDAKWIAGYVNINFASSLSPLVHPPTPVPGSLPRLLIVLSSTEYSMHAQMLPLSLNHAGPSALKRSTMQERGEATTVQKERGRERGRERGKRYCVSLGSRGAWWGISMDSSLITDFVPLSELYMMKRWERSSAIFYSLLPLHSAPSPIHTRTLGPLPSSSHHSLALPVAYSILTALIQAGYSSRPD